MIFFDQSEVIIPHSFAKETVAKVNLGAQIKAKNRKNILISLLIELDR